MEELRAKALPSGRALERIPHIDDLSAESTILRVEFQDAWFCERCEPYMDYYLCDDPVVPTSPLLTPGGMIDDLPEDSDCLLCRAALSCWLALYPAVEQWHLPGAWRISHGLDDGLRSQLVCGLARFRYPREALC